MWLAAAGQLGRAGRLRTAGLLGAAGLLAMAGLLGTPDARAADAPGGAAAGDTQVSAVWKVQTLHFLYLGRTARYSCIGLEDKMQTLLLALGARRDLSVHAQGCGAAERVTQGASVGPSVNIVFSSPVPGRPSPGGDVDALDARFEPFSLASDAMHNMQSADCELVQQFVQQILPKLATRNVKTDISCSPYEVSGGSFMIRGEVLRAVARR
jgi:hypothetical protein